MQPNLVQTFYDLTLTCVPAQFRKKTLSFAANHFAADFAFWASGDLINGFQVITTHNWQGPLPSFAAAREGVVFNTVVASDARALIIRDVISIEALAEDPSYVESLAEQGMKHALVMSDQGVDQIAKLRNIICFFRSDEDAPFVEVERAEAESMLALMSHAVSHNLEIMALQHGMNGNAIAVCDWQGRIYMQNDLFEQVMKIEFGTAQEQLPLKFPRDGDVATLGDWRFNRRFLEYDQLGVPAEQKSFYLVTVAQTTRLDRLTKREAEIAKRVATGESYKVVAAGLGIAPSTVGNSMRRVYSKLQVQNRAGLIAMLHGNEHQ